MVGGCDDVGLKGVQVGVEGQGRVASEINHLCFPITASIVAKTPTPHHADSYQQSINEPMLPSPLPTPAVREGVHVLKLSLMRFH